MSTTAEVGGGGGGAGRVSNWTQRALLQEMSQLRSLLTESALAGEFNIQSAGRSLNVFAIEFNSSNSNSRGGPSSSSVRYKCPPGSVPVTGPGDEDWARCVYCPIGTFFNVVNEVCEPCSHGSYQPLEGQLSCLVCPHNTSTKVTNAKRSDDCQGGNDCNKLIQSSH